MKKRIIYIAVLVALIAGCKKSPLLLYNDIARIQLSDTSLQNATFVYDAPGVIRDTEYIRVDAIGGLTSYDRAVKLEQVPEYISSFVRDPVTNQVTDTISTEMPFKALPGVHYVDFNDPSLQPLMVVKADSVSAMIPIVLLRDTSLKANTYRLHFQLVANDQFKLGEKIAREKTLAFSDHLERFASWLDRNGSLPFYYFGKYSTGKHQFMIDVLGTNIDQAWFDAANAAGALPQYQILLRQALATYNTNPDNIASGKAPLRETDLPDSAPVIFP